MTSKSIQIREASRGGRVELTTCEGGFVVRFEFDEDAFTGACERGVDHTLLRTIIDNCEAVGATGIVQRPTVSRHVRNTVLQLHEHVWAMVDTQAVTGAEVLVDPHPHDV